MSSALRTRRLPEIALQFGPGESGVLSIPDDSLGTVVVLAPAGSSPIRSSHLAELLQEQRLGTLRLSLALQPQRTAPRALVEECARRLGAVLAWMGEQAELGTLPIGALGIGPAAAAILRAAEAHPGQLAAVVSVAGWTELVEDALPLVETPTLLIEGPDDEAALDRARQALHRLGGDADLKTVPGDPMAAPAGRRQVAELAGGWCHRAFADAARSVTWRLTHQVSSAGPPMHSLFD